MATFCLQQLRATHTLHSGKTAHAISTKYNANPFILIILSYLLLTGVSKNNLLQEHPNYMATQL